MGFVAGIIGDVVGSVTGAKQAGEAGNEAGQLQYAASQQGIAEQRRQFDILTQLMSPYVEAGLPAIQGMQPYAEAGIPALQQQQALAGLLGPEAEQAAIAQLSQSPQMMSMIQQGENALLQNASATGGLRGGNTQAALAQFRPQVLSSLINQQYARLGGFSSQGLNAQQNLALLGQSSAAGQGAQGMNAASNIGNLLNQGGAALAGGKIAQGTTQSRAFNDILGIAGATAGFM